MDHSGLYPALSIFVALVTFLSAFAFLRPRTPVIPGPRGLPLLGNMADLTGGFEWIRFGTSLRRQFGDFLGLRILHKRLLVLNSASAAKKLLDKRANNYSSRPVMTFLGELMGLNRAMPLMPYGPEWKAARKLALVALNPTSVKQYRSVVEHYAAKLALDIVEDPSDFYELTRLCASRIILAVTYGISARATDSEYLGLAEEVMSIVTVALQPGAYLCDVLPILKHLPRWVPFQRQAAHGRRMFERFVTLPFERAKGAFAAGTADPSMVSNILASMPHGALTPEMDERVKWTAGSMFAAGGESTFGTLAVFIIAMALNPDKQALAQQEIDSIVGSERLPSMSDKPSLPYVDALIQEVIRWHPMLPLSIARCAEDDDERDGYRIAKDTIVLVNNWSIAMEPNAKYPPDQFIPERFMDKEHPTPHTSTWAFGFGRRLCPGKAFAEEALFASIATLLATLEIRPPREGLAPEFYSRITCLPKQFNCILRPRSQEKVDLLRRIVAP
ncbi:cytochrome P450 [Phanerochaete sordida]|uniref:Cytochrome P450 n=1 Tax=Phanerochaete sordida TaxID=48140 RepID=A0A9P3FVR7_9APHY|nr:cytochrome P450 [Phanerochaete sordida]